MTMFYLFQFNKYKVSACACHWYDCYHSISSIKKDLMRVPKVSVKHVCYDAKDNANGDKKEEIIKKKRSQLLISNNVTRKRKASVHPKEKISKKLRKGKKCKESYFHGRVRSQKHSDKLENEPAFFELPTFIVTETRIEEAKSTEKKLQERTTQNQATGVCNVSNSPDGLRFIGQSITLSPCKVELSRYCNGLMKNPEINNRTRYFENEKFCKDVAANESSTSLKRKWQDEGNYEDGVKELNHVYNPPNKQSNISSTSSLLSAFDNVEFINRWNGDVSDKEMLSGIKPWNISLNTCNSLPFSLSLSLSPSSSLSSLDLLKDDSVDSCEVKSDFHPETVDRLAPKNKDVSCNEELQLSNVNAFHINSTYTELGEDNEISMKSKDMNIEKYGLSPCKVAVQRMDSNSYLKLYEALNRKRQRKRQRMMIKEMERCRAPEYKGKLRRNPKQMDYYQHSAHSVKRRRWKRNKIKGKTWNFEPNERSNLFKNALDFINRRLVNQNALKTLLKLETMGSLPK